MGQRRQALPIPSVHNSVLVEAYAEGSEDWDNQDSGDWNYFGSDLGFDDPTEIDISDDLAALESHGYNAELETALGIQSALGLGD